MCPSQTQVLHDSLRSNSISMDIFVARQPILDRKRCLVAYELLFRGGPENLFPDADGDLASSSVIGGALFSFGLDALVGHRRAFVNVTEHVLVEELWTLLPRERVVLELLETVEPNADVIEACRAARAAGYALALDDFVMRPDYEPLIELADIVKVDFLATPSRERRLLAKTFGARGIELLAEKVETEEDVAEGIALGYGYFQGFFFERPEMVARSEIPVSKMNSLRLLRFLSEPEIDLDRVEQVIKQEVALSVRLLRFLNTAVFSWREPVRSIKQALLLVGEQRIRKIASLLVVATLADDGCSAAAQLSLQRAHWCETLAPHCGLGDRELDAFLTGLLSLVDRMLGRPLAELLGELGPPADVEAALLRGEGALGALLQLAKAWERADWDRVARLAASLGIPEDALPSAYAEASEWSVLALD